MLLHKDDTPVSLSDILSQLRTVALCHQSLAAVMTVLPPPLRG